MHVVLFEPEIPPNTGNIIRLCANTGCQLHLIQPLGFDWDDKRLRRAGLDYGEFVDVRLHAGWPEFCEAFAIEQCIAFSTKASQPYTQANYQADSILLFGPETRGLPKELLESFPAERRARIPMLPDSRSMNLSNSVAIVVYEAWRQQGFEGGA